MNFWKSFKRPLTNHPIPPPPLLAMPEMKWIGFVNFCRVGQGKGFNTFHGYGLPGSLAPNTINISLAPKWAGLLLLQNSFLEAMGAQLISGAQQISMVLGLGSQEDQMAERANGSPGSPINQELMEPIELWSLVTSGTQQPWKPTGSPVPYGAHQVVKFILIRWMRWRRGWKGHFGRALCCKQIWRVIMWWHCHHDSITLCAGHRRPSSETNVTSCHSVPFQEFYQKYWSICVAPQRFQCPSHCQGYTDHLMILFPYQN